MKKVNKKRTILSSFYIIFLSYFSDPLYTIKKYSHAFILDSLFPYDMCKYIFILVSLLSLVSCTSKAPAEVSVNPNSEKTILALGDSLTA